MFNSTAMLISCVTRVLKIMSLSKVVLLKNAIIIENFDVRYNIFSRSFPLVLM